MRIQLLSLLLLSTLDRMAGFRCMNFYGLETPRRGFVCDWAHPPLYYLTILKHAMQIDMIRLPFSREYIEQNDYHLMDSFILDCASLNMSVILDYHRTWESHQGPTPEEGINLAQFQDTWKKVALRYNHYSNVVGIDIFNEYQGRDASYIINIQNRVISVIESMLPGRYIYYVGCTNWGGDCEKFRLNRFNIDASRLHIDVHKYVFSGTSNPPDWDISIPNTIPAANWFIGETGWKNNVPQERQWAETFLSYLNKRNITDVCAWTIAHSGDTDGWWEDNCETFDWNKASVLNTFWDGGFKRLRELYGTKPRLK